MSINDRFDVVAGFSPPLAKVTGTKKGAQWKAEAFHYIDYTDFDKPIRNFFECKPEN